MRKLTLGKIVKNGVTYSGSSDNANNVKYNNNASNLDATNVQEAIDKLDESVDTLNSNLGGMKFGIDSNGNYGYIKAGADSVTPFSSNKRYSYSWTSSNNEQKTLTLEIEPKYIAFTVGGNSQNAVLYDVENQEYIINASHANIITSVNGKVVTINTYHGSTAVNYLNYW